MVLARRAGTTYSMDSTARHIAASYMPPLYIYVVGPSSTGKTTLCDALNTHFPNARLIKEVARTVMTEHGYTRDDVGRLEMQSAIMMQQISMEESVGQGDTPLVLCDRSAVDALVFARLYIGQGAYEELYKHETLQSRLLFYRGALFVLCNPVDDWKHDDGVRSMDDQYKARDEFTSILRALCIPFRQLGPETRDLNERVKAVVDWAQELQAVT